MNSLFYQCNICKKDINNKAEICAIYTLGRNKMNAVKVLNEFDLCSTCYDIWEKELQRGSRIFKYLSSKCEQPKSQD